MKILIGSQNNILRHVYDVWAVENIVYLLPVCTFINVFYLFSS